MFGINIKILLHSQVLFDKIHQILVSPRVTSFAMMRIELQKKLYHCTSKNNKMFHDKRVEHINIR